MMTGFEFQRWLVDMRKAGLARFDADVAKLLGVSANTILNFKLVGCDKRTALACSALLCHLPGYGDDVANDLWLVSRAIEAMASVPDKV